MFLILGICRLWVEEEGALCARGRALAFSSAMRSFSIFIPLLFFFSIRAMAQIGKSSSRAKPLNNSRAAMADAKVSCVNGAQGLEREATTLLSGELGFLDIYNQKAGIDYFTAYIALAKVFLPHLSTPLPVSPIVLIGGEGGRSNKRAGT
jgi:hypothetical protein